MNETKIYLVKFKNLNNIVYIGNTQLELNKRLRNHKYHKTSLNTYITKNNISWDDVYIELYENFKYNNRIEYENRETEVIKIFQEDINYNVINTNKNKINNTYNIKKDVYLFLIKSLNNIIKEKIKEYENYNNYEYKDKKRLEKIERVKQYNIKNKEELKNKREQKYNCDCGGCYTYGSKSTHIKTKKHQSFFNL